MDKYIWESDSGKYFIKVPYTDEVLAENITTIEEAREVAKKFGDERKDKIFIGKVGYRDGEIYEPKLKYLIKFSGTDWHPIWFSDSLALKNFVDNTNSNFPESKMEYKIEVDTSKRCFF